MHPNRHLIHVHTQVYFESIDRNVVLEPEEFEKNVYMMGTCKRLQVPLKLAWALTIHKGQGQTLDKVCLSRRRRVVTHIHTQ